MVVKMSEIDSFFLHPYYKVMRFFMILIGQWPYNQSKMQSISRTAVCLVFAFVGHAQIRKLIACSQDVILFIQVFPPVIICTLCFCKYCTCWICMNKMRDLLEHLKNDWSVITIENELEILGKYTNNGRILGLYYMICTYVGIGMAVGLQLVPPILDILMPLDKPRPHKPLFEADFFANQDEHYYVVVMLGAVAATLAFTVSGASDLIYLSFVLHGCGTFSVLSYRLEHMFNESTNSARHGYNDKQFLCLSQKVAACVQLHCRILKYIRIIVACYDLTYLVQLILIVILLSGLLVHLCDALTVLQSISESMVCVIHFVGLLFIVFLNILPAQMLLNNSAEIFHQVYFSHWFAVPWRIQKSLVIIMQNSIKPQGLCAYSLITASLQLFATIVHSSISYFTVLYTIQK